MKYITSLMGVEEFSHCKNPLTARASFYLDDAIEEVAEEWVISATACPANGDYVAEITINGKKFFLCDDGEVKQILKSLMVKTGNQTWNGDDVYYDELDRVDTVGETVGVVENFEIGCESIDGLENIACQIINITMEA